VWRVVIVDDYFTAVCEVREITTSTPAAAKHREFRSDVEISTVFGHDCGARGNKLAVPGRSYDPAENIHIIGDASAMHILCMIVDWD
jgi:hypothetical protein